MGSPREFNSDLFHTETAEHAAERVLHGMGEDARPQALTPVCEQAEKTPWVATAIMVLPK